MKLSEIKNMPTKYTGEECEADFGIHQSIFRSDATLRKVVELLRRETPHSVILDIIEHLQEDEGEISVTVSRTTPRCLIESEETMGSKQPQTNPEGVSHRVPPPLPPAIPKVAPRPQEQDSHSHRISISRLESKIQMLEATNVELAMVCRMNLVIHEWLRRNSRRLPKDMEDLVAGVVGGDVESVAMWTDVVIERSGLQTIGKVGSDG